MMQVPSCGVGARGFTLVELLVVLAIAGLLLATTPPLVSAVLPGVQLKAAAREIAATLRLTRELAIARGQPVAWMFDVERGGYWIEGDGRGGRLPSGLRLKLVAAAEELRDERHGAIRFYPDGTASGGRVLLARGPRGYQVGVEWLTGRVRLATWEPE